MCKLLQLLILRGGKRNGRLADHVLSGRQRSFHVVIVLFRMCRHIDSVYSVKGIVAILIFDTVDICHLSDEFSANTSVADRTNQQLSFFRPDLRAGNALGARKIDYLAILIEIIKLSDPIGSDRENIDIISSDIVDLLSFIFLNDDLVRKTGRFDCGNTFNEGLLVVDLPSGFVIVVACDADDQIVAERLCPFQKANMPVMQQVICTVCNNLDHETLFLSQICKSQESPFLHIL